LPACFLKSVAWNVRDINFNKALVGFQWEEEGFYQFCMWSEDLYRVAEYERYEM
jgi:hypothetical protein